MRPHVRGHILGRAARTKDAPGCRAADEPLGATSAAIGARPRAGTAPSPLRQAHAIAIIAAGISICRGNAHSVCLSTFLTHGAFLWHAAARPVSGLASPARSFAAEALHADLRRLTTSCLEPTEVPSAHLARFAAAVELAAAGSKAAFNTADARQAREAEGRCADCMASGHSGTTRGETERSYSPVAVRGRAGVRRLSKIQALAVDLRARESQEDAAQNTCGSGSQDLPSTDTSRGGVAREIIKRLRHRLRREGGSR